MSSSSSAPPARLPAATKHEIDLQVSAVNALHAHAVSACFSKCVPRPRDGELSIGEMACVDRCVPKYLEAQELVRAELETARNKVAVDYP